MQEVFCKGEGADLEPCGKEPCALLGAGVVESDGEGVGSSEWFLEVLPVAGGGGFLSET